MPTAEQAPFPPFDRFADTVAKARVERGLHPHLAEEVVAYVLDGQVHHEDDSGHHTVLRPGMVLLITAHEEVRHDLTMQPSQEGRGARWLSMVLRLPWHTQAPVTSLQMKEAGDPIDRTTTVIERPIVGSRARADSALGLECSEFEFTGEAETAIPLGRGKRGVAYVLQGSGRIEKEPVEVGTGATFEDIQRLAVHGSPGFRLFLASVPRPDSDESYPQGERFQGARYPGGKAP
jgi:redox-sensitive bicupin YhaK (pirin superfamily)